MRPTATSGAPPADAVEVVKLDVVGEVVPLETITDFLEPMSQDDIADREDADEPGIGPS